jgi:hypothetical protein
MVPPENPAAFVVDDPGKIHAVAAGKITLPPPARNRVRPGAGTAGPPSSPPVGENMWDLFQSVKSDDDPDELLKPRFLCRAGGLLMVGATGIGKSTLAMQFATCWARGQPAMGIEPIGQLKSLIIQAENDRHDMREMFTGVVAGLHLDEKPRRIDEGLAIDENPLKSAGLNVVFVRENARSGVAFFTEVVRPLLEMHKPDLLWIDPALAYLGGESNNQRDVGAFLRNQLNVLIDEFHCGVVVLHHTNKPTTGKESAASSNIDSAYSGTGSAEWANWARAVLFIKNTKFRGIFELVAGKRGGRLGWKEADGTTPAYSRFIAHSKEQGQLYWREPVASELPVRTSEGTVEMLIMDIVPAEGTIPKNEVLEACKDTGVPERKARVAINKLIAAEKLFESQSPRAGGPSEKHLSRTPQPAAEEEAAAAAPKKAE